MQNGSAKDKKDRISIRIDHQRHLAAQAVAEDLGSDLGTVINMFLSQMIKESGLPFKPTNQVSDLDETLAEIAQPNSLKQ